jgi:HAD superfamily hydrolase (TIGR01549 family)
MATAFLFDMDGVLLRGRNTDPAVYETAAERVLESLDADVEAVPAAFRDPSSAAEFSDACEQLGVPATKAWRRREQVASEIENETIADGEREAYDDAWTLNEFESPVGVVSNNRHETVSFVVEHLGIDAAVAIGRDPTLPGYKRRKPDSHYLDRALSRLGSRDAVYVGDRYSDVRAARDAGVEAVLLDRDGDTGETGTPEPDRRVRSLTEL